MAGQKALRAVFTRNIRQSMLPNSLLDIYWGYN